MHATPVARDAEAEAKAGAASLHATPVARDAETEAGAASLHATPAARDAVLTDSKILGGRKRRRLEATPDPDHHGEIIFNRFFPNFYRGLI
jgi:hypothetical protein